jgi:hypothetical protein
MGGGTEMAASVSSIMAVYGQTIGSQRREEEGKRRTIAFGKLAVCIWACETGAGKSSSAISPVDPFPNSFVFRTNLAIWSK